MWSALNALKSVSGRSLFLRGHNFVRQPGSGEVDLYGGFNSWNERLWNGRFWRKAVIEVSMLDLASSRWLDLAQTSS
jgi:hypothetical protein